jgi:acyl-CoA synthetase (AMP-forming)/AMP-acid ligase II
MANYKVPRYIQVVERLPTNPSGKILKSDLRDRAEVLFIGSNEERSNSDRSTEDG